VKPLVQVLLAVGRNRGLRRVMLSYAVFMATQNAVWIAMLVFAYEDGGAATAGVVAVAQLLPAALVAPWAATLADRQSPVGVLAGGYLIQVGGMLGAAVAIALESPLAAYACAVGEVRSAQLPERPDRVSVALALGCACAELGDQIKERGGILRLVDDLVH
jgi:hypothetical protein